MKIPLEIAKETLEMISDDRLPANTPIWINADILAKELIRLTGVEIELRQELGRRHVELKEAEKIFRELTDSFPGGLKLPNRWLEKYGEKK